jgi:hypothetical protein
MNAEKTTTNQKYNVILSKNALRLGREQINHWARDGRITLGDHCLLNLYITQAKQEWDLKETFVYPDVSSEWNAFADNDMNLILINAVTYATIASELVLSFYRSVSMEQIWGYEQSPQSSGFYNQTLRPSIKTLLDVLKEMVLYLNSDKSKVDYMVRLDFRKWCLSYALHLADLAIALCKSPKDPSCVQLPQIKGWLRLRAKTNRNLAGIITALSRADEEEAEYGRTQRFSAVYNEFAFESDKYAKSQSGSYDMVYVFPDVVSIGLPFGPNGCTAQGKRWIHCIDFNGKNVGYFYGAKVPDDVEKIWNEGEANCDLLVKRTPKTVRITGHHLGKNSRWDAIENSFLITEIELL